MNASGFKASKKFKIHRRWSDWSSLDHLTPLSSINSPRQDMPLPYICNECRRSLLRRVPTVSRSQWQTRASFTSLSDSVADILPRQPKDAPTRQPELKERKSNLNAATERFPRGNGLDIRLDELFAYKKRPPQRGTAGRYSRPSEDRSDENEILAAFGRSNKSVTAPRRVSSRSGAVLENADSFARQRRPAQPNTHGRNLSRSEAALEEFFAFKSRPTQQDTPWENSPQSEAALEEEPDDTARHLDDIFFGFGHTAEPKNSLEEPQYQEEGEVAQIPNDPAPESFEQSLKDIIDTSQPQPTQSGPKLEHPEAVATQLDAILQDSSKDATEAYRFFIEKFPNRNSRALRQPPLQDRRLLLKGVVFDRLLKKVTTAWCETDDHDQNGLTSPTKLAAQLQWLSTHRVEHTFGSMHRPEHVLGSIWIILVALLKHGIADSQEGSSPLEHEVLRLWAHIFKHFVADWCEPSNPSGDEKLPQPHDEVQSPLVGADVSRKRSGSSLESVEPVSLDWTVLPAKSLPGNRVFSRKLRSSVILPNEHVNMFGAVALATFDHFARRLANHPPDDLAGEAEPLLTFIARAIPGSDVHSSVAPFEEMATAAGLDSTLIEATSNRMRDYPIQANYSLVASALGVHGSRPFSRDAVEEYFASRLTTALDKSNLQATQRLWEHAVRAYTQISEKEKGAALSLADSEEDAQPGALPSKLYSVFLYTLTGLGRHDIAVKVWNYMIQHGTKPTTHQYNAMMQGCGRRKDIDALNRIWQMMHTSGVQFDVSCWTTRVHAMALSGRSVDTIRLLDEMSDTWKQSQAIQAQVAKGKNSKSTAAVPSAVQPSVEVLNSCVTVFARKGRRDLIQRAFAWGHAQGIKPDHITFNALISLSLRSNNIDEALKLLAQMSKQGTAPDDATFAIIMNAVFRSNHIRAMAPEEQNSIVVKTLEGMHTYGLGTGPTADHIYAMFVDRLLKDYGNIEGAKTVINIMRERGVIITPHVYTSLMTYYFEGSAEPDFAAVENLWGRMRTEGSAMDHVFFDRMIEMYARAGETGQSLMFLGRMSNQGNKPSKSALMELLEALMRQGQWDRVRELVRDIKKEKGYVKGGIKHVMRPGFERKFWAFIEEVERDMQYVQSGRDGSRAVGAVEEPIAATVAG